MNNKLYIFKFLFFGLFLFGLFTNYGCKKSYVCACEIGFKKHDFESIDLPIPNSDEKFIIQSQLEYNEVFKNYIINGGILPAIDFQNKTLLGALVDYSNKKNFTTQKSLCYKKRNKEYLYTVFAKQKSTKEMYYPKIFWIVLDKIDQDNLITIKINKK